MSGPPQSRPSPRRASARYPGCSPRRALARSGLAPSSRVRAALFYGAAADLICVQRSCCLPSFFFGFIPRLSLSLSRSLSLSLSLSLCLSVCLSLLPSPSSPSLSRPAPPLHHAPDAPLIPVPVSSRLIAMGRMSRFAFPLSGRKAAQRDADDAASSASDWTRRYDHAPSLPPSKASRLLGTVASSSRLRPPPPDHSPTYVSITVSEADHDDDDLIQSAALAVNDGVDPVPAPRPAMFARPSSTLLPAALEPTATCSPSQDSGHIGRLRHQMSSSTMQSHYDASSSPLSISQQTSASAVRDHGLRKGYPSVTCLHAQSAPSTADDASSHHSHDTANEPSKKKPARLDLSSLFPRPKANGRNDRNALLSPSKLVSSPAALSATSDTFRPKASTKLTKQRRLEPQPVEHPPPRVVVQRDPFDNAKVNVRRPPRGIQHWWDGLGDDSDASDGGTEAALAPALAASASRPNTAPASKDVVRTTLRPSASVPNTQQDVHRHVAHNKHPTVASASQHSVHSLRSHVSNVSAKTKESAFAHCNLHDSSVLSMSSGEEDESGDEASAATDYDGEIQIGKAHTMDFRPQSRWTRADNRSSMRPPSVSKASLRSVSTNAATIEVMYSPEVASPTVPRPNFSRKSFHSRQSSTATDGPLRSRGSSVGQIHPLARPPSAASSGVRSILTTRSEPRPRTDQHKLMAVTEEEKALLEMMRRKREAMGKTSGAGTPKLAEEMDSPSLSHRSESSVLKASARPSASRMSSLVSMGSFSASTTASRKSLLDAALPPLPNSRGKAPRNSARESVSAPRLRIDTPSMDLDSRSNSDSKCSNTPSSLSQRRSPTLELSDIGILSSPSRTPVASLVSPTTASHPSPPASPITPSLPQGTADFQVKVAGSEPSFTEDDDGMPGFVGVLDLLDKAKTADATARPRSHSRRRTASSGAAVTLPADASRPESLVSAPQALAGSHHGRAVLPKDVRTKPSAMQREQAWRASVRERAASPPESNSSRSDGRFGRNVGSHARESARPHGRARQHADAGAVHPRASVSEDVLAAWGSLGGLRGFPGGAVVGL